MTYELPLCPTDVHWTDEGAEALMIRRAKRPHHPDEEFTPIYSEWQMQDMQCQQDSDDAGSGYL